MSKKEIVCKVNHLLVILFGAPNENDPQLFTYSKKYAADLYSEFTSLNIKCIEVPVYSTEFLNNVLEDIKSIWNKDFIIFNAVLGSAGYNGDILEQVKNHSFIGCDASQQRICNNKYLTKQLIKLVGVSVAEGSLIQGPENFHCGCPEEVIVKPNFGSRSKGITRLKSSQCFNVDMGSWLIENFIDGDDVTVLCMGQKFYAARIITDTGMHSNEDKETQNAKFEIFDVSKILWTCRKVKECLDITNEPIRIDGRFKDEKFTVLEVNTQSSWAFNSTGGKTWQVNNPGKVYSDMLKEVLESLPLL